MKREMKLYLPYAIALAIAYYAFPLLMKNTGLVMLVLLCAVPAAVLACGVIFSLKNGFGFVLPALSAVLFIPAIFLYMNAGAWPYAIAYGVVSLMGEGIGRMFHNKR